MPAWVACWAASYSRQELRAGEARQARIRWRPAISTRYERSNAGRRGETGEDQLEASNQPQVKLTKIYLIASLLLGA